MQQQFITKMTFVYKNDTFGYYRKYICQKLLLQLWNIRILHLWNTSGQMLAHIPQPMQFSFTYAVINLLLSQYIFIYILYSQYKIIHLYNIILLKKGRLNHVIGGNSMKIIKHFFQKIILFVLCGYIYCFIELIYRGYTHISMFLLSGFLGVYCINLPHYLCLILFF